MKKKIYVIFSVLVLVLTTLVPSFSVFAQGTLNVDLSINAVNETTLAGQDALYRMDFKVTGIEASYTDSKLVVTIPKGYELNTEATPLNQLQINGVTPVYDQAQSTLSYQLGTISSGQTYSYVLRVKTKNGTTPNGIKLNLSAAFTAGNLSGDFTSSSAVTVQASNTINISKTYLTTQDSLGNEVQRAPLTNDIGVWNVKLSGPNKQSGLQYFKEGSTIKIIDTLPTGLSYISDDLNIQNGTKTISGQTITWTFPVPTTTEQMTSINNLFSKDFNIKTKFINKTNFAVLNNTITVSGTAIDNTTTTNTSSYSIGTGISDPSDPISDGSNRPVLNLEASIPGGYADVKSKMSFANVSNLALWDDDIWTTGLQFASQNITSRTKDFSKYSVTYTPDSALYLKSINTLSFTQRFGASGDPNTPLVGSQHPSMNITITINGIDYAFVEDASDDTEYLLYDFLVSKGLPLDSLVSKVIFNFNYAPPGINGRVLMTWSIKKGTNRQIKNTAYFDMKGYDINNKLVSFNNLNTLNTSSNFNGVRTASVTARPAASPPVASTSINLENQTNGVVNPGTNRVVGSFTNVTSSAANLTKDLTSLVVLPKGVTLDTSNPDYKLTNSSGNASGTAVVLPDNGSGQQRVLIKWNDSPVTPGESLNFAFNVSIAGTTVSPMEIFVYSGSGNSGLSVPTTAASITDSSLVTDTNDLNSNGNTTEALVKSGNKYTVLSDASVNVKKAVKGNLDSAYSSMGHVSPGGKIDYQVSISDRNLNQGIEQFDFMDVLPSVGDLGLSDNIARNSKFTPILEGPITVPATWKDKVTVSYSKSKNPTRYALSSQIIYPSSSTPYTDPATAEAANWISESNVLDWSQIHSYAIKLKSGVSWSSVSEFNFNFSMRAPTLAELKASGESSILATNVVGDPSKIDEKERSAWNSFAYRENTLQMIEPLKVGVAMTDYTGNIYLLKYINKNSSDANPKIDKDYQLLDEEGLKGAEFKLLDSDGKEVSTATTDENGQIHFKNVWFGDYTLVETKAPEGYELYKKEIKVKVSPTENNGVAIAFAGDDPITKLPDAGGDGNALLPIIIFASLSLVGLTSLGSLYLFRKKKEE